MKITRQSESFGLTDANELYTCSGNISRESSGTLSIYFNINKVDGDYIGDCHYNKYVDNNNINFGVNCPDEMREDIMEYANSLIASALTELESIG